MKRLILLRHAESEWTVSVPDADRRLTERGTRNAALMAQKLFAKELQPDIIISSPALRTRQTLDSFKDVYKDASIPVRIEEELYPGSFYSLCHAVENIHAHINTALIIGHNPYISDFINSLELMNAMEMPPAGMMGIAMHAVDWQKVLIAEKKFLFFERP